MLRGSIFLLGGGPTPMFAKRKRFHLVLLIRVNDFESVQENVAREKKKIKSLINLLQTQKGLVIFCALKNSLWKFFISYQVFFSHKFCEMFHHELSLLNVS